MAAITPAKTNAEPSDTLKLLSELERSWAMFQANWKVVDLFAGMQIWQEDEGHESFAEPLNRALVSACSAAGISFVAGLFGGAGFGGGLVLAFLVLIGVLWSMSSVRARRDVPCFKTVQVIDGSPSEIFMYLMNLDNYPMWDTAVESAYAVQTIDDHSDIIRLVYKPMWLWPTWLKPRDACLLRYWRRTDDGSYVICLQSTVHPECPKTQDMVRATCKGSGYIISPRELPISLTDDSTSLVTNVVHLDPQGWESSLLLRFNRLYQYLKPHILVLSGLQEVMEARKYVTPNISEEFTAVISSAEEAAGVFSHHSSTGEIQSTVDKSASVSTLKELPTNVSKAMWAEPDGSTVLVRGPDYLTDRRKIPSAPPLFRMVGVDLFETSETIDHIAARSDNVVQKELARHRQDGTTMPFTFIMNFMVPGSRKMNLVVYYQLPHPSLLTDGSPTSELLQDFLEGSDDFRDERFKLIPCIVQGSFIVRQAVGNTPTILGKKLRQVHHRGEQYFELGVDIASSAVANRVVGLVSGYAKKLVIDMGFVLEAQQMEELPERLLGTARLTHLDLSTAVSLD